MKNSLFIFSLLSGTVLLCPDILIASGISTHTHTDTPGLKPASFIDMAHSYKTASVCFMGYGDCDPNTDYSVDTAQQCLNEGFNKQNCNSVQIIDGVCSYNSAYGKGCKCRPDLVTCSAGQVGIGAACNGKYASCQCSPSLVACASNQTGIGASCGGKYESCVCKSEYQYNSSNCSSPRYTYGSECGGKYTGCTCPSGVSAGSFGCDEYYPYPCSSVCKRAKNDNCDKRSAVNAPYGCMAYWEDCSSKCKTAYPDNCRSRDAVSCPYGCASYWGDCSSKCQSCTSCSNSCTTGSTSSSCGSGYKAQVVGTTQCGNTCYSCEAAACPDGYSTDITSCPAGYTFKTSGVSAGKACGICECRLTSTSCANAYEATQSCVKGGVTYYKCELCHRSGGSAEGLYYCYNNDGSPSYGFTPVSTVSVVCGNKNYRTSCGCETARFFNRPYIGTTGSGYVKTICGERGYRGNYVNNESWFYRGFVAGACEENGRNVGFNKCSAYKCGDKGYKVVEAPTSTCGINETVCCCPEGYSGTPNSSTCKQIINVSYVP